MENMDPELMKVMKAASRTDKTVILTTSNGAWAEPGSIIDMFLESFRIGNNTIQLLNHVVIVSMDQKAQTRCKAIHEHCYLLKAEQGIDFSSEAYFLSPNYLKMMWTRIRFLATVLEMGFNFVFTDADVMWLRDPFPHFNQEADFQISCDQYYGNPHSSSNNPNGGFNYVKSNNRTILFYKFWLASSKRYPRLHDQDVLNRIKNHQFIAKIRLSMRFLDTTYFSGFCEASKDLNSVCTIHANCCFGMASKIHDLKIVLEDWKRVLTSSNSSHKVLSPSDFRRVPQMCNH